MKFKTKVKAKSFWGKSDREHMKEAFVWAANYLKINYHIDLVHVTMILDANKSYGGWTVLNSKFRFFVGVSARQEEEAIETLFHEMVHLRQYVSGKMIDLPDDVVQWKGKEITGEWAEGHTEEHDAYWNAPWEVEARKVSKKMLKKYKKKVGKNKKILDKLVKF